MLREVYRINTITFALSIFLITACIVAPKAQYKNRTEQSELIAMRLIGHRLLSCIGDDTSRVSSVVKSDHSYRIAFEDSLSINPSDLELIVSEVIATYYIAENYWVEVYSCHPQELEHSYQMGPILGAILTCGGRIMPSDCYEVLITLYYQEEELTSDATPITPLMTYIPLLMILVIGIFSYYSRRANRTKQIQKQDRELISIGDSVFDKKNLQLSYKNQTTDLSHKEGNLLIFLHQSANTPVERTEILRAIWDDEGDYVGRTLDVFISRLRKKLHADQSIKIMNIRGVGYKMLISD